MQIAAILAGSWVETWAAVLVFPQVPEKQTAPDISFRESPSISETEWSRAFSDTARVRMPLALKGLRSLVLPSDPERLGNTAETNRPKTLRAQNNNTLPHWWTNEGAARTQAGRPDASGTLPNSSFFFLILFLVALSLHCCPWAISSCREQGLLSSCDAPASHCGGFSLRSTSSRHPGFSSRGIGAQ